MATTILLKPLFLISSLILIRVALMEALPLSTKSRWIVDEKGQRVKLACVNWVSHLEVMVAEGLSKQPVDEISKSIKLMGFNCVRLTWPLYLATNQSLASLTVQQSFNSLGLSKSMAGIQANNPSFVNLSLISAFEEVVASLTNNKVMVILDNHVSKAGWCCDNNDGNGFFGDRDFNPHVWLNGLRKMASRFKHNPYVIGMSLRNELRGPKQNVPGWYRYMQRGAEVVHRANPDVLVILSGLNFDTDLSFLQKQPVKLSFINKLVFEFHWYSFSNGLDWKGNPNQVCGNVLNSTVWRAGFLLDQGFPLFVSEFGIDIRGTNVNDDRYFNCFLAWAAEHDLDWALWTLFGDYYLREGVVWLIEYYGLLDWNSRDVSNTTLLDRLSSIQPPFQGPGISDVNPHKIIYHPLTGLCILRTSPTEPLKLGKCPESDQWSYTDQKTLTIQGTSLCLQAQGINHPAKLSTNCEEPGTSWQPISDSKLHLSTSLGTNSTACLEVDSNNNVIASACKCLSGNNTCDPASQWFKIVDSNVGSSSKGY